MKKASILILQYGKIDYTKRFLDSLYRFESLKNIDVLLLDNATPGGSGFDVIKEKFPEVKLYQNSKNIGFAAGVNQLAKHVKTKYVFFINNDIILENNAVSSCVELLENKEADVVTCKMLNTDGSISSNCSFSSVHPFHLLLLNLSGINRLIMKYYYLNKINGKIRYANGGFLGLKTDVFIECGMFNEYYFMYVEDIDLMLKLYRKKVKMYLNTSAVVTHDHGASSKSVWSGNDLNRIKNDNYMYFVANNYCWFEKWILSVYFILRHKRLLFR